ncbi:MAG: 6-carboxytetrahydropterin synthase [Bacteroidia bacterium]|nr:6-carboxytetrahydropterin synthase [Bacteroidia bacterium]
MAKIRVNKQFTFDMAHALYNHNGACRNIHGHTYTLTVTLLGEVKTNPGKSDDGMLVDFSWLKELVKTEIISVYDHALVLNGNSPHRDLKLDRSFDKVIYLDVQPTCENLLLIMVRKLKSDLPPDLTLQYVSLQETPTAKAEWCFDDNF